MPLTESAPDALLHIDAPVSAEQLGNANALIQAEMDQQHATTLHHKIPQRTESKFSELVEAEHVRIAAGSPKEGGLDLSRYELLDAPENGDLLAWKLSLQKAYTSAEYLRGREINLSLLETYGKNAWLVGNSQLEDTMKGLEKELETPKLEHEEVENARRALQTNAGGEMTGLDQGWKTGVRRMIETQAAGEKLRLEVLERKRQGVS